MLKQKKGAAATPAAVTVKTKGESAADIGDLLTRSKQTTQGIEKALKAEPKKEAYRVCCCGDEGCDIGPFETRYRVRK